MYMFPLPVRLFYKCYSSFWVFCGMWRDNKSDMMSINVESNSVWCLPSTCNSSYGMMAFSFLPLHITMICDSIYDNSKVQKTKKKLKKKGKKHKNYDLKLTGGFYVISFVSTKNGEIILFFLLCVRFPDACFTGWFVVLFLNTNSYYSCYICILWD